jgi:hypothetical protein
MSTIKHEEKNYNDALNKLREQLKNRWGYAPRIAKKLSVKTSEVYQVVYGKSKNPIILKELVNESKNAKSSAIECFDIMNKFSAQIAA